MKSIKFRVRFEEEMLGTKPSQEDVFEKYIAKKRAAGAAGDELAAAGEVPKDDDGKGVTVFHRNEEGRPILWDYMIKGFFKDAAGGLYRCSGTESAKIYAYKKVIDTTVFVFPRRIQLVLPGGCETGVCERPLRAQTMQGERVALARSETVPAGTVMEFEVEVELFKEDVFDALMEWMDYGKMRGIGQWRNSGKGRFTYELA